MVIFILSEDKLTSLKTQINFFHCQHQINYKDKNEKEEDKQTQGNAHIILSTDQGLDY
jgi:hypothetical protein